MKKFLERWWLLLLLVTAFMLIGQTGDAVEAEWFGVGAGFVVFILVQAVTRATALADRFTLLLSVVLGDILAVIVELSAGVSEANWAEALVQGIIAGAAGAGLSYGTGARHAAQEARDNGRKAA